MILFGSGVLSALDENSNNIAFGILQNVEVNINFSKQSLRGDNKLYPVKEYYTEGELAGTAEYAEILATQFNLLIGSVTGGTAKQRTITIHEESEPNYFKMTLYNETENNRMTLELFSVSSPSLSFSFAEGDFVIPSFDWSAIPSDDDLTDDGKKKICQITLEEPTADDTPPTVTASNPADGESDVDLDIAPEITFSEPINVREATDANNYFLMDSNGDQVAVSTITYDASTYKVTLTPTNDLDAGASYSLIIGTGIQDLNGNNLAEAVQIDFTTASS